MQNINIPKLFSFPMPRSAILLWLLSELLFRFIYGIMIVHAGMVIFMSAPISYIVIGATLVTLLLDKVVLDRIIQKWYLNQTLQAILKKMESPGV